MNMHCKRTCQPGATVGIRWNNRFFLPLFLFFCSLVSLTADPCDDSSVSPLSRSHGTGAEAGSIAVAAGSGCAWTATPSAGWITITSGGSSSGNGTVNYALVASAWYRALVRVTHPASSAFLLP
jgi:hypothetical protein